LLQKPIKNLHLTRITPTSKLSFD